MTPRHSLWLQHRYQPSGFCLDVALALDDGWNVLFGASGAGKSSILRAVAGLLRPQAGQINFAGETWIDTATGAFVAPEKRRISYVAQSPALFPHLTVLENIRFGQRYIADPATLAPLLSIFRCEQFSTRKPASLSGGEKQRVALARALAVRPRLLLLDEPFRGLDTELRDTILDDLQTWLSENPVKVIAATHDPIEALAVQATVFRIAAGMVVEKGQASEILRPERERMLARLTSVSPQAPSF